MPASCEQTQVILQADSSYLTSRFETSHKQIQVISPVILQVDPSYLTSRFELSHKQIQVTSQVEFKISRKVKPSKT